MIRKVLFYLCKLIRMGIGDYCDWFRLEVGTDYCKDLDRKLFNFEWYIFLCCNYKVFIDSNEWMWLFC